MRNTLLVSLAALGLASCSPGGTSNLAGNIIIEDAPGSSPTCSAASAAGELCVEGDIETTANLEVDGTATLTGAITASGALSVTGAASLAGGYTTAAVSVTDTATLDADDCGKPIFVSAGIDTKTITLPALSAVTAGCRYEFHYVGADGAALLDISPNSADGVEGGCTLAGGVIYFSGTDDADIGLTKGTGLTGDAITIVAGDTADWYVASCQGIWANN